MNRAVRALLLALLLAQPAAASGAAESSPSAAALEVHEVTLDNGMRLLVVPRPRATSLAAGWAVASGSADETPGRTGVSHLLEHLLFKGTRTIGARQPELEERLLRDQDRLFRKIRKLEARGSRRGAGQLAQLRRELEELRAAARGTARLGELSFTYSRAGATQLDAGTLRDLALYHVILPPERLELWFWLESDRLLQPVFREFFKEKAVVAEERRLRVESTPTGLADERLDELFWRPLPYRWRPLGLAEDLAQLERPAVEEHFRRHYTAPALTAALVGPVDPERVRELAQRYFGRLPAAPAPAARPAFPRPALERELVELTCDCPPQARVLYPTVPFRHPDSYPLQVLAGLLNGRAGRLHRSLVQERGIAFSASALQYPLRRAGYFQFSAETRGAATSAELVEAWDAEVATLAAAPIPRAELERIRNRLAADGLRRWKEPAALMKQLLIYDGLGSWREIHEWTDKILRVSEGEVRAAARRYLTGDGEAPRLVALYSRERAEGPGS